MDFQATDDVLAVVVVKTFLVLFEVKRSIAVEHADAIVDDGEILAFHFEQIAADHHANVTAQAADTANVRISNEFLDALAVVKDLEVERINGVLQRERELELTELDGKFVAWFILNVGVYKHG